MACHKIKINKRLINNNSIVYALMACFFSYSAFSSASENNLSYSKETAQNWLIRGMYIDIKPLDSESHISSIGGKIQTPEKRIFGVEGVYFFSKNFSLEIQGGVLSRDYRVKDSKIGSFEIGTIESNSVSMTAQYHINTESELSPYFGIGINHAWERKVKPAEGIPAFKVGSINSLILNAGIDYRISESWFLNIGEKYILSPEYQFSGYGFNASVKMNTLITGVGIAYLF